MVLLHNVRYMANKEDTDVRQLEYVYYYVNRRDKSCYKPGSLNIQMKINVEKSLTNTSLRINISIFSITVLHYAIDLFVLYFKAREGCNMSNQPEVQQKLKCRDTSLDHEIYAGCNCLVVLRFPLKHYAREQSKMSRSGQLMITIIICKEIYGWGIFRTGLLYCNDPQFPAVQWELHKCNVTPRMIYGCPGT